MEAMLDSNLCIRVLRDRPIAIKDRFRAEAPSLCISSIVYHELHFGVLRSGRPEIQGALVEEFVTHIPVLDFDLEGARHAADIKAALTATGNLIGPNDLLIAGHARSLGLKLITGNLREFTRVEGLHCEDWL